MAHRTPRPRTFISLAVVAVIAFLLVWPAVWPWLKPRPTLAHPVWQQVRDGQIYAGQDVEEAIRLTEPLLVIRTARYTTLLFNRINSFNRLWITVRDGEVVGAGWHNCGEGDVWFDKLTAAEREEYWQAWDEHLPTFLEAARE